MHCLEYLVENGLPVGRATCDAATMKGDEACIAYWSVLPPAEATDGGDCTQAYLQKSMCKRAAARSDVERLKSFPSECLRDPDVMLASGSLKCVRFLREEMECPWHDKMFDSLMDEMVFGSPSYYDRTYELLKYVVNHGSGGAGRI